VSDQIHLLEKQKNRKSHPIHLGTHFNRTYGYDNACADPLLGDLSSLNDKKNIETLPILFQSGKGLHRIHVLNPVLSPLIYQAVKQKGELLLGERRCTGAEGVQRELVGWLRAHGWWKVCSSSYTTGKSIAAMSPVFCLELFVGLTAK
jgi:hypothetical protein